MRYLKLVRGFLSLAFPLLLGSCGGNTSGTGGITFEGKVLRTNNQPISMAVVVVLNTGDTATTDAQGSFLIQTNASGELQIEVETSSGRGQTSIKNIPNNSGHVTATLVVDDNANLTSRDITISSDDPHRRGGSGGRSSSNTNRGDGSDESNNADKSSSNSGGKHEAGSSERGGDGRSGGSEFSSEESKSSERSDGHSTITSRFSNAHEDNSSEPSSTHSGLIESSGTDSHDSSSSEKD